MKEGMMRLSRRRFLKGVSLTGALVRDRVHVISGIDNVAARLAGQGNGHFNALSGLMTGTPFTGRGAGGPSIDQILAGKIGSKSRFHSLQVGVARESHGELAHRN